MVRRLEQTDGEGDRRSQARQNSKSNDHATKGKEKRQRVALAGRGAEARCDKALRAQALGQSPPRRHSGSGNARGAGLGQRTRRARLVLRLRSKPDQFIAAETSRIPTFASPGCERMPRRLVSVSVSARGSSGPGSFDSVLPRYFSPYLLRISPPYGQVRRRWANYYCKYSAVPVLTLSPQPYVPASARAASIPAG